MLDCNIINLYPDLYTSSSRSTAQQAVEASLGLAQTYIAQGDTTAALQVMTVASELRMLAGPSTDV